MRTRMISDRVMMKVFSVSKSLTKTERAQSADGT